MPFVWTPLYVILLPIIGVAVGTLGSMLGLGGGFVLIPILILLFPEASTVTITSISLIVVFLNAVSSSIANVRTKRPNMRVALLMACAGVPAAVVGALASAEVSRQQFQVAFGTMLLIGAAYIFWRSAPSRQNGQAHGDKSLAAGRGRMGLLAGVISPVGGFVSSFFGIGGGVISMPALVYVLGVPPKVATATSLLVLVPTSLVAILTHVLTGQMQEGWRRALALGIGAIIGGQLGVTLSGRVPRRVVLAMLSVALVVVGVRQILTGWW